jgi:hypothetical protein
MRDCSLFVRMGVKLDADDHEIFYVADLPKVRMWHGRTVDLGGERAPGYRDSLTTGDF